MSGPIALSGPGSSPVERLDAVLDALDALRAQLVEAMAMAAAPLVLVEEVTVTVVEEVTVEVPAGCPSCPHCSRELQTIDHAPRGRRELRQAIDELEPRPGRRRTRT